MKKKALFIVIDGPDGSGKSSICQSLVHLLNSIYPTVYTFEPTESNEFGMAARNLMKCKSISDANYLSELLTQDRKVHLERFILPHLNAGTSVVCDRYKYSALAYQHPMGIDAQYLIDCNSQFIVPDLTFILSTPNLDVLLKRIEARKNVRDVFETKSYLTNTLLQYNSMKEYFPNENIFFLDALLPINSNIQIIKKHIEKFC